MAPRGRREIRPLGCLTYRILRSDVAGFWRAALPGAAFALTLSGVIEWFQPYVGRTRSAGDMMMNILGVVTVLAGFGLLRLSKRLLNKVSRSSPECVDYRHVGIGVDRVRRD